MCCHSIFHLYLVSLLGEKGLFYMLLCSQKFDNSRTSIIYFSTFINTKCLMLGGKWMGSGDWHTQNQLLSHREISSFLMKQKLLSFSRHLHSNVTEMYGKGKYVEINDNKAMTVSWTFLIMTRFLSGDMQNLSRPEA